MRGTIGAMLGAVLVAAMVALAPAPRAMAQDGSWQVTKSSGEIWIDKPGAQPVALTSDAVLAPGDTIRTGGNGRVLLKRGAETIMVSPNSVIGVPVAKGGDGMQTTIMQRSGSILLDVEKKNVQHFEVVTPYLAAVVKGTQFRVTVEDKSSRVEVVRGQVQVTDYKSGQRALVNQDQSAAVSLFGAAGLSLSGSGALSPIEMGTPGRSPVSPVSGLFRSASADAPAAAASAPVFAPAPSAPAPAPRIKWSQPENGNGRDSESWVAWGKNLLSFGGAKKKDGDDIMFLAIPVAVGLSVAAGAMAVRRRRNGPPQKPGIR